MRDTAMPPHTFVRNAKDERYAVDVREHGADDGKDPKADGYPASHDRPTDETGKHCM